MSISPVISSSPSPRRPRRLRFTLRLFLALITLLCICLAIWTYRAREQRRLVERIRQGGGKVSYRRELAFGWDEPSGIRAPRLFVEWLGDDYFHDVIEAEVFDVALLTELPRLQGLECLHFNCHVLTDDDFAPIAQLRRLKAIDIYGDDEDPNTQIGDRSMRLLAELPVLELVNVEGAFITARGLAAVAKSKSLEKLYVSSPHESMNELAADPLRQRLTHLQIRHSVPGGFGRIVEQWFLPSPPGPRSSTSAE